MTTVSVPTGADVELYVDEHGALTLNLYSNPDLMDPDVSVPFTLEELMEDFVDNVTEEDGRISNHENIQISYNLLDSLRNAIRTIEDKIYEDEESRDQPVRGTTVTNH